MSAVESYIERALSVFPSCLLNTFAYHKEKSTYATALWGRQGKPPSGATASPVVVKLVSLSTPK